MRRARRSNPLTLAAAPALALSLALLLAPILAFADDPTWRASDRVHEGSGQVEQSERVRAVFQEMEVTATARSTSAWAEERRLTEALRGASEQRMAAEAAVRETVRFLEAARSRAAEAKARLESGEAVLRQTLPPLIRLVQSPIAAFVSAGFSVQAAKRDLVAVRDRANQARVDVSAAREDLLTVEAAIWRAEDKLPRRLAVEADLAAHEAKVTARLSDVVRTRIEADQAAINAARGMGLEAARMTKLRAVLALLETQHDLDEARAREDNARAEREQKLLAAEAARFREAALTTPAGAGSLTGNARPTGQLMPPVEGPVIRGWGDLRDGEPAAGLSFQTSPGARVVAPCGGAVVFAEPFRGYGPLIIVDCGGGHHAVLSGFDQIAVVPGQVVQEGAPVGVMAAVAKQPVVGGPPDAGPPAPGPPVLGSPVLDSPVLYMELRKAGQPVNPAPWLKISG